ncbi:hypothetical protein AgCh_016233 [Apium graveolens]
MGRGDGGDTMHIENGGRVDEFYYNYECTDEEGDRYAKAHIQNNWKQLLSKEKSRADERVKLAISLGYTHATRLMVKPHYFNEGAWESITKHWETEKFKKASEIGRNNRAKLDFNHKSGVVPFCVRRWLEKRSSLSGLLGADEAARLMTSQSAQASQTSIPDNAYSLIRRVLSEVTNMVKSLDGMDRVPRAKLNELIEKSATIAFPDNTNPVQQSSWDQYMRIANEIIDQVMQNFEKVIVEDDTPEKVPGEHTRLLLEMDDEHDLVPNLLSCPLYE